MSVKLASFHIHKSKRKSAFYVWLKKNKLMHLSWFAALWFPPFSIKLLALFPLCLLFLPPFFLFPFLETMSTISEPTKRGKQELEKGWDPLNTSASKVHFILFCTFQQRLNKTFNNYILKTHLALLKKLFCIVIYQHRLYKRSTVVIIFWMIVYKTLLILDFKTKQLLNFSKMFNEEDINKYNISD